MFNRTKAALITGGCGFVGRNLTRRLLKDGYSLWIVDDCSIGKHCDEWLPGAGDREEIATGFIRYDGGRVHFLHADARDFFAGRLEHALPKAPAFGDVFHLAAIIGGRAVIDGNPM